MYLASLRGIIWQQAQATSFPSVPGAHSVTRVPGYRGERSPKQNPQALTALTSTPMLTTWVAAVTVEEARDAFALS